MHRTELATLCLLLWKWPGKEEISDKDVNTCDNIAAVWYGVRGFLVTRLPCPEGRSYSLTVVIQFGGRTNEAFVANDMPLCLKEYAKRKDLG
jgi:hypothetical protein